MPTDYAQWRSLTDGGRSAIAQQGSTGDPTVISTSSLRPFPGMALNRDIAA
ncbi:MAG: hypothetical protein AAGA01_01275 [Cyanobacteria bacterium P01_E01_bin.43]